MKRAEFIKPITVIIICLLCCTVTATFSWFNRTGSSNGQAMEFAATAQIRSQNCTVTVYSGTKENNDIVYEQTPVTTVNTSIPSKEKLYFKAVITNNDTTATNVTLYSQSSFSSAMEVSALSPTKTNKAYSGSANVPCAVNVNIPAGSVQQVEWFVNNTGSASGVLQVSSFYAEYN